MSQHEINMQVCRVLENLLTGQHLNARINYEALQEMVLENKRPQWKPRRSVMREIGKSQGSTPTTREDK